MYSVKPPGPAQTSAKCNLPSYRNQNQINAIQCNGDRQWLGAHCFWILVWRGEMKHCVDVSHLECSTVLENVLADHLPRVSAQTRENKREHAREAATLYLTSYGLAAVR